MTTFRPKLWTGVSAAILIGAAASGCGGQAGDEERAGAPEGAPGAVAAPVGEGGEAAEMGASSAYGAIPAESKTALQLAHLKGFYLIAQAQKEGEDAAAALAGQGLLEVYDTDPEAFRQAGVDEAVLRKAAQTGAPADLRAAVAELDRAQERAGGDPAAVAKGLVNISSGIYREVIVDGSVDPVEYQHALGSALAAQRLAERQAGQSPKLAAAKPEIDRLVALWPAPSAPEQPTPTGEVLAQASRVELALS